MAKLIGYYFNKKEGVYTTFEIDGLKETTKQFSKTPETINGIPRFSFDYWTIMPKSQIDVLRVEYSGFTMYSLQENLPHFKEMVIANLTLAAAAKKEEYDKALGLLEVARNG